MASKIFSVLITGANRGIGLEFVRQLANAENPPKFIFAGCRTNSDGLKQLVDAAPTATKIQVVRLDVTNDQHIESAAKEIQSVVGDKGLTLLINNSGILIRDGALYPTAARENLQEHFNVNATSTILMTQAFLPLLKKSAAAVGGNDLSVSRAAIVNISSELGSLKYSTQGAANYGFSYKCSKAALNMFTKCLSVDLKNDGILCVSLCPGWVKTDMGSAQAQLTPEQSINYMLSTLCKLNASHNGAYLNRNGEIVPW